MSFLLPQPVILLGFGSFLFLLVALPLSFWSLGQEESSSSVRFLIILANVFLTAQLVLRWWQSGHFPVSNLYESLCFLAWACTISQLIIERNWPSPIVPASTTPMALLSIAFASFVLPEKLQDASPLVPALQSSWLIMHVSVIMSSYATLLVGSLLSVAVLVVDRDQKLEIRSSSIGSGGFRTSYIKNNRENMQESSSGFDQTIFSRVESLDSLSYRAITVGFLLLTVGLISGAVWANEAWGSWWSWDPKETWALISWLVYAAYLHARITRGWQGRKPAILALLGLFVVSICYIGVNLLGVGLHSYGWFFD